jgi:peptide/nickel transport system permease protein
MGAKRNPSLVAGLAIVGILTGVFILGFLFTPYDANLMDLSSRFLSPSAAHPFGTDNFGRDVLSRVMIGTRTAFLVGLLTVLIGGSAGLAIGATAGYSGGLVDEAAMRLMDAMMAFPGILLALVVVTVLGPGTGKLILALGLMFVPSFARIARGGFLQYRDREFVLSARSWGAGPVRIMALHILPNAASPMIVAASVGFANAVIAEASLSYLGIGVQPPDPSWGRMLSESQAFLFKAPWCTLAPAVAIALAVLGFNLLGDGIRAARKGGGQ